MFFSETVGVLPDVGSCLPRFQRSSQTGNEGLWRATRHAAQQFQRESQTWFSRTAQRAWNCGGFADILVVGAIVTGCLRGDPVFLGGMLNARQK
jgi:hypothetical protein